MSERFINAISGENGSPALETAIAISVALTFVLGLGALGAVVVKWVAGATGAVYSLHE